MSPQTHVQVDEKHFDIVGPTCSNTVGEFRKRFSSVWIALILGKLAERFIYKRSLVITEAVCCDIFEPTRNGGKTNHRDALYAN